MDEAKPTRKQVIDMDTCFVPTLASLRKRFDIAVMKVAQE